MHKVVENIIRQIAADLEIDVDVVDRIVSNQGKQANKAALIHNELEFSGFGKLMVSQNKLRTRLKRMENILLASENKLQNATTQEEVVRWTKRVDDAGRAIEFYRGKLKPDVERYYRRVEKSSDSPA